MNNDLISRSALLEKAIGVVVYDEGGWDCNVRAVPDDVIEKAPAVDAEPVRHSFWESYSTSAYGGYKDGEVRWLPRQYYRCERCRKGSAIRSHYCPSCGAKMEG